MSGTTIVGGIGRARIAGRTSTAESGIPTIRGGRRPTGSHSVIAELPHLSDRRQYRRVRLGPRRSAAASWARSNCSSLAEGRWNASSPPRARCFACLSANRLTFGYYRRRLSQARRTVWAARILAAQQADLLRPVAAVSVDQAADRSALAAPLVEQARRSSRAACRIKINVACPVRPLIQFLATRARPRGKERNKKDVTVFLILCVGLSPFARTLLKPQAFLLFASAKRPRPITTGF